MFYVLHSTMFCAGWLILLIIGHHTQEMRRAQGKYVTDFGQSFDERKISGDEWKKRGTL